MSKLANHSIDADKITPTEVTICATTMKLAVFGVYIDPFMMEFGMKQYLQSDGIEFEYDYNCIQFILTLDFLKLYLNLDQVIKDYECGGHTVLDNELTVKWNRKNCILYISKFKYLNENSRVIERRNRVSN